LSKGKRREKRGVDPEEKKYAPILYCDEKEGRSCCFILTFNLRWGKKTGGGRLRREGGAGVHLYQIERKRKSFPMEGRRREGGGIS